MTNTVKEIPYLAMLLAADPNFYQERQNPVMYEFGERKFRGRYNKQGAYADVRDES